MPDYNLAGLDTRTFQQLMQALALREIGPGVVVFGDGRDGARDAAFTGPTHYPSASNQWNGYIIIQAKYRQKPSGNTEKDGNWALSQLRTDLDKFIKEPSRYKSPDYYIYVTNIDLTPVPETGTEAQVRRLLEKYKTKTKIRDFDVWDGNKIRRLLDAHRDIAITYGGYITPGDVLARMQDWMDGLQPNFDRIASEFLQGELVSDQYARLREAGSAPERKTPLARVFVDLPVTTEPDDEGDSSESVPFVRHIVSISALRMDRKSILERNPTKGKHQDKAPPTNGRLVLIGGPGQGKSTLGQFICQLYRAELLRDRPRESLDETALDVLATLDEHCMSDSIPHPTCRRFPIRIDLKQFADNLSKNQCNSIIEHIAQQIDKRSTEPVNRKNLNNWLATYPWLLVLDGLDEVPATGNRSEVLDSIAQFSSQCATRGFDLLIIATSRPQGYGNAFEDHIYCHRYLQPLSTTQALHYAERLVENIHHADFSIREEIISRLRRAVGRATTERLMRTPLQVTIMAILAELTGDLPDDRWELFRSYYKTIYDRETQRGIAPLSTVLSKHRRTIDRIHRHIGLHLQVLSEIAGHNNATLKQNELISIIKHHLQGLHPDESEVSWIPELLSKAALDRLVFLVSPREDEIGFEIRSLQEFMAAEAIMEGDDRQIRERLAAIAPYVYWRNVFLFTAGKCASEREYIIPDIVLLCQTLSDETDPEAATTLAGARLALDLLEDDTFRSHPKACRVLAEIALKLLALPPSNEHVRLANALRENRGLEAVYTNAISQGFRTASFNTQLSTWLITSSLISRGLRWPEKLADENWPSELPARASIINSVERHTINTWLIQKAEEIFPQMPPFTIGFSARRGTSELLNVIEELIQNSPKIRIPIRISPNTNPVIHADINDWKNSKTEPLSRLLAMPTPARSWYPIIAHARYSQTKTKEAFAQELNWLADHNWPFEPTDKDGTIWKWFVGWPLVACISVAKSADELRDLAHRISTGELEGPEELASLEVKWQADGLDFDEFLAVGQKKASSFRHMLVTMRLELDPDASSLEPAFNALLERHKTTTDSDDTLGRPARQVIASLIIDILNRTSDRALPHHALDVLTPLTMLAWLKDSSSKYISINLFANFIKGRTISPSWIEAIDTIGRGAGRFYHQSQNETESDALTRIAASVSYAFRKDPSRIGLLRFLAACGLERIPFASPFKGLELPKNIPPHYIKDISVIKLALGDVTIATAPEVARDIHSAFFKSDDDDDLAYLFDILRSQINSTWMGTLLIELTKCQKGDSVHPGTPYALLNDRIAERKSLFHVKDRLRRLGLADTAPS